MYEFSHSILAPYKIYILNFSYYKNGFRVSYDPAARRSVLNQKLAAQLTKGLIARCSGSALASNVPEFPLRAIGKRVCSSRMNIPTIFAGYLRQCDVWDQEHLFKLQSIFFPRSKTRIN